MSDPSVFAQDCSFPAYFYTQPMATGPGFYDNLCPQSWQDGSAATWTLQDPHQQSEFISKVDGLMLCQMLMCCLFWQPSTARATKRHLSSIASNMREKMFRANYLRMFCLLHSMC